MMLAAIIVAGFIAGATRPGPPLIRPSPNEDGFVSPQVAFLITFLIVASAIISISDAAVPDWYGQLALGLVAGGAGGEVRARIATKSQKNNKKEGATND